MSNGTQVNNCQRHCWIISMIAGLLVFILLLAWADWRFVLALLGGVVVALVLGWLLPRMFCSAVSEGTGSGASVGGAGTTDGGMNAAGSGGATAAGADSAGDASGADASADNTTSSSLMGAGDGGSDGAGGPAVKPTKKLAGEEDLAARKGDWKYEGAGGGDDAATDQGTGGAGGGDAASGGGDGGDGIATDEAEPETLTGPRGTPDDLKKISGVGPKLEGVLNDLGFYHFWQIAAWGPQEVAWVDSRLKFKGRIERDNWIAQAKAFSEGQEL